MKKIFDEIVILIVQIMVFYIFPIFAVPTDSMGIIILIVLATFILSLGMGGISKKKIKYYYPIIISLIFVPVTYIYHNEFDILHSLWCLISSYIGVIIGDIIMNRK